jgi:hypothetical protein
MKKFNEWREETSQNEDPAKLLNNLDQIVGMLKGELENFQGPRFEGFLNIIGGVRQLQYALAEISHEIVGDTNKFATEATGDGKAHGIRGMKKINKKEVVSKGVRHGEKDLSKDYKGHIGMNGEEAPFKVMK